MMAEKTVGEILEEQGVIKTKEEPKKEDHKEDIEEKKISFLGEIKIKQLVMDIEKLKAEVEGLREVKFSSDERIKELAESTGEIRSILFQKDSLVKELEARIKLIDDSIAVIDPKKIAKDFQKQEERVSQSEAKSEKVEAMYRDIFKKFEESKNILESIKSVENLKEKVRQMEELVNKSLETKAEVDRLAGRTEKFYTEIEDKIKDFSNMKATLEKLDGLTKEMTKSIDEINIKLVGSTKKEDIETFKKTIDDIVISNKEKIEGKLKEIEDSLNISQEDITYRIEQLERKREGILNLMNSLEEQYRRNAIKKGTFDEVRSKNETLLQKIDDDIKKLESQKGLSIKTLPKIINEIEDGMKVLEEKTTGIEENVEFTKNVESRTYVLENSMTDIREKIKQVGPEKMVRMANAIEIQTEIVNDILTKLKEVNKRLMDAKVNLSDYENRTRLFEILNILVRSRTINEISNYLAELEKLIFKMKLDKLWNNEKQTLTENLLMELSENWHENGRDDVSKLFTDFLRKIKTPENIIK